MTVCSSISRGRQLGAFADAQHFSNLRSLPPSTSLLLRRAVLLQYLPYRSLSLRTNCICIKHWVRNPPHTQGAPNTSFHVMQLNPLHICMGTPVTSLCVFILVINQLDAKKICFTISLFHASTCFDHHVLISRRSKLYYTASGIITPIGGRPVRRLRQDSLNLCTGRPTISVMIPEAV